MTASRSRVTILVLATAAWAATSLLGPARASEGAPAVGSWCMNHNVDGLGNFVWETEVPGFAWATTNAAFFQRTADGTGIVILQSGIYDMNYNVRLRPVADTGEGVTVLRVAGVNHGSDHHSERDPGLTSVHHGEATWPCHAGDVVTVALTTGSVRLGNAVTISVLDGSYQLATTTHLTIRRVADLPEE